MGGAVSWEVAERVATWVGSGRSPFGRPAPPLDAATNRALERDFEEATARAEELVVGATGLRPLAGRAEGAVLDRPGWVRQNLVSFRRLLDPLLEKFDASSLPGPFAAAARGVGGAQLGTVLGWMSTRVLGQYDLLLAEGDPGDVVCYVGPNIVALERRHGFPPEQFRLWIALHEVTHRCQFTAVPWLHAHFLSLVDEGLAAMSPDPTRLLEAIQRAAAALRGGRNPLEDAGALGLVASPEQLAVIRRIQALMSLLEGHGDITMNRAGSDAVPEAAWFARTLRERRRKAGMGARVFQQLLGIDAKLRQYDQGERFIEQVEGAGGAALFARVWESPWHLPSIEEIAAPEQWVHRVGAASGAARPAATDVGGSRTASSSGA